MGLGNWLADRTGIHPTVIAHKVGEAASNPWVQGLTAAGLALTGVGAPAAAGIMAAERGGGALLKPGGNIGDAARGGVEGAVMGYGASKAGDLLHGGASLASKAAGLYGAGKTAVGNMTGGAIPGLPAGAPAGGYGSGDGSGISPGVMALAGLQTANAANLGKTANDYAEKGWNAINDSYQSRAGLRSAGISGLLNPVARNTAGLDAIRMQNPVAARAGLPQPQRVA